MTCVSVRLDGLSVGRTFDWMFGWSVAVSLLSGAILNWCRPAQKANGQPPYNTVSTGRIERENKRGLSQSECLREIDNGCQFEEMWWRFAFATEGGFFERSDDFYNLGEIFGAILT